MADLQQLVLLDTCMLAKPTLMKKGAHTRGGEGGEGGGGVSNKHLCSNENYSQLKLMKMTDSAHQACHVERCSFSHLKC